MKHSFSKLPKYDFIVNWIPPEHSGICPSSVAQFFAVNGCTVKTCRPQFRKLIGYDLDVPIVRVEDIESCSVDLKDLVEWVGAFCLGCSFDGLGGYLSTYETPTPSEKLGQVQFLQWTGYFSKQSVEELSDLCR